LALETGLDAADAARLERLERAALACVPHVIVTSPWTRRELAKLGVSSDRVDVVEPGSDRPARPAGGRCDDGVLRLLTVGTVTPRKGHALLVDALAGLADRPWQLRCAGSLERDPVTAAALTAQIARLALTGRISLLGELAPAAVDAEYAAADLFVLPSYLEGYGMAIAEAVAHGLPVVSTTVGAIPDTLPQAAGVLVPPGDSLALQRTLATLMDDGAKLRALAAAATAARDGLPTWADASARFAGALERARRA
jgi:glycosyltransferase involved in cell wall biosynthesis